MILQTIVYGFVDQRQRFVDFQAGQFEGCLPFNLQNRPDGGRISGQNTMFSNLLLVRRGDSLVPMLFFPNLGIPLFYPTLNLTDATAFFFSFLARELSFSRVGL